MIQIENVQCLNSKLKRTEEEFFNKYLSRTHTNMKSIHSFQPPILFFMPMLARVDTIFTVPRQVIERLHSILCPIEHLCVHCHPHVPIKHHGTPII